MKKGFNINLFGEETFISYKKLGFFIVVVIIGIAYLNAINTLNKARDKFKNMSIEEKIEYYEKKEIEGNLTSEESLTLIELQSQKMKKDLERLKQPIELEIKLEDLSFIGKWSSKDKSKCINSVKQGLPLNEKEKINFAECVCDKLELKFSSWEVADDNNLDKSKEKKITNIINNCVKENSYSVK